MSQQTNYVYGPAPSNTMGTAGFVVSLVGLLSCGILCPVGFVMSLIGLRKQPRGLATAGVVIGALGTIWGVIALIFGGLFMLLSCGGVVCGGIVPHIATNVRMDRLVEDVEKFQRKNGRMPGTLDEATTVRKYGSHDTRDGWGRRLHLLVDPDGTFTIQSDGPDGHPETDDDIHRSGRYDTQPR
jgi:hypothetical protein